MTKLGEVKNRDAFLKNIAGKLGRQERREKVPFPEWELKPQDKILTDASPDELVETFKQAAQKINTKIYETEQRNLAETLKEALSKLEEKDIIIENDQRFEEYKLMSVLDGYNTHTWNPDLGEENIQFAKKAGAGITFSDYTLAESATIVLTAASGKGRSVSLLPKNFVAIVPKSTIVPRITQVTNVIYDNYHNNHEMPSCIKFISGPSNTADIESSLVVGVHGPISASYIIVEDC